MPHENQLVNSLEIKFISLSFFDSFCSIFGRPLSPADTPLPFLRCARIAHDERRRNGWHGRQWQWQQEPRRRDDDNEDKVTLHCMRARASACNGAEEISEADPILLA